ncbi:MAG: pyruvate kinase [Chlamydiota bacterium]|nr:pyruvate kinase [Chlamydiota bacterium]
MSVRTKIICTIGPSVSSYEMLRQLIDAGMNVARINFSHGTYEQHEAVIRDIKKAREDAGVPVAIMLDTKGPEVRLGEIAGGSVSLVAGQTWKLSSDKVVGDEYKVSINPGKVLLHLEIGAKVLFDDGYVCSHVVEKFEDGIEVQIENSGEIKSGKGVNFPYANLDLPSMTDKDIADLAFGCKHDLEMVAASFVRSADDVLAIKNLLAELKKPETLVIAKIENHEGVDNFDSIVQIADGIMVARGDLGVEVPLTQVPKLQKMMIRKCYLAGKPAVTATQMLESMITNPRPTRAEASDVANAIYDSTSAVMLSGETAIGKYPIETVKMMKNIALEAEVDFDYHNFFNSYTPLAYHDVPTSVTLATVKTAYNSDAKAIFAFTSSGKTARLLARLRPKIPILAMTSDKKRYHQMALNWGVIPIFEEEECHSSQEAFDKLSSYAVEHGLVRYGDLVIITAGSPFGVSGTTNMMIVESIGHVLVRGESGLGPRVHGKVTVVHALEGKSPYQVKNKIIVLAKCDESYLPLIKEAAGVVLQNHVDDLESETFLMQQSLVLNKPVIVRATNALNTLNESQLVTIDPSNSIVYKGVVL